MKLSNLVAGISILRPYYDDPDGHHIGAEHDQIYCYPTDRELPPEDVARMRELDWFQEGDEESGYQPEESWSAFT